MGNVRPDDFAVRREHLAKLSDEEIFNYFWKLADELVEPMLEAGKIYTTPAIERSVLLRMGFSSLEAGPLVQGLLERGLLGHGAGNAVWRIGKHWGLSTREAGLKLLKEDAWAVLPGLFEKEA